MDAEVLGRSHRDPANAARSRTSALLGGPVGEFDTEVADHTRMRHLLQPHFSPKHMRTLEAKVETLCTGLLDELEQQGPPADLLTKLAQPLPVLVICDLRSAGHALCRSRTLPIVGRRVRSRSDGKSPGRHSIDPHDVASTHEPEQNCPSRRLAWVA
jgi:hypothetical protein